MSANIQTLPLLLNVGAFVPTPMYRVYYTLISPSSSLCTTPFDDVVFPRIYFIHICMYQRSRGLWILLMLVPSPILHAQLFGLIRIRLIQCISLHFALFPHTLIICIYFFSAQLRLFSCTPHSKLFSLHLDNTLKRKLCIICFN